MKNVMVAIAMHLLFAPTFAADESKTPGIADHGPRFSTEGKGWRLDQARINDPDLPRVLLIGDSILAGYFKHVAKDLEGQAYVDAWVNPHHQSEHLNKLLADVLEQGPYDFVHFNMGLHGWVEGRIKPGTFEPLTKAYVQVLKAKLPNAKLIWASSTPVTKQDSPTELEPEINPIIVEHNRMAAKVMAEMSVPVNDFYSLLVEKKQLARGDRFHWTAPAYRILADKTSQSLLQTLRSAEKKPIPDRLIVLTFDDGNKSDIRFVAPLLERLGFNATFFVNRGQADGNGPRLSWADMRELQ